jgi:hypothetical protein
MWRGRVIAKCLSIAAVKPQALMGCALIAVRDLSIEELHGAYRAGWRDKVHIAASHQDGMT